ncbi:hypothetical protein AN648_15150, partial [Listeria monocytogenes]
MGGRGVAVGVAARVVVLQHPHINGHILHQLGLVAAVEIHLDGGGDVGVGIPQPADRRVPGAHVETIGQRVIHTALNGGLVVG